MALAGLVWQFPTSCAWAARVYVSNADARSHGRRACGLPSSQARFQALGSAAGGERSWWQAGGAGAAPAGAPEQQRLAAGPGTPERAGAAASGGVSVTVLPRRGGWRRAWREDEAGARVCSLALPPARGGGGARGPRVRLSLPSFSGATPEHPGLLRYACQLAARVRLSPCAGVQARSPALLCSAFPDLCPPLISACAAQAERSHEDDADPLAAVLSGRPVLALTFDDLEMRVEQPQAYAPAGRSAALAGQPAFW